MFMTSFFHSGGAPSAPPRLPSQRAGGAGAPPCPPTSGTLEGVGEGFWEGGGVDIVN